MPILTAQIGPDGPIVNIMIGISRPRMDAMKALGQNIPPPIEIRALIDTGASCTVIDNTIINNLGLVPTGTAPIHTPSTGTSPHICNQYDISIAIPMGSAQFVVVFNTRPAIGADLSAQGIQGLIGRDLLEKGTLWYNGLESSLSIAF